MERLLQPRSEKRKQKEYRYLDHDDEPFFPHVDHASTILHLRNDLFQMYHISRNRR